VQNKIGIIEKTLKCIKFSCCLTMICNTQTHPDLQWGSVHQSTLSEDGSGLHICIDCLDHRQWLTVFYWLHVALFFSFLTLIPFCFFYHHLYHFHFSSYLQHRAQKNTKWLKIHGVYKLLEYFAKPYFHKYWTEMHDVTTI
jgi:hypothetical protein